MKLLLDILRSFLFEYIIVVVVVSAAAVSLMYYYHACMHACIAARR